MFKVNSKKLDKVVKYVNNKDIRKTSKNVSIYF